MTDPMLQRHQLTARERAGLEMICVELDEQAEQLRDLGRHGWASDVARVMRAIEGDLADE